MARLGHGTNNDPQEALGPLFRLPASSAEYLSPHTPDQPRLTPLTHIISIRIAHIAHSLQDLRIILQMASATLLSNVRARVTVDVDSMDPDDARRHTTDAVKFCDMTSNQAIVHGQATRPERAELFKTACSQIKSTEGQLDIETQVSDTIDLFVCLLWRT